MKRRTRWRGFTCAAATCCGTFLLSGVPPADAMIQEPHNAVVQTSDSPPEGGPSADPGSVTVVAGDTLSAIGTRTSRTWEQLAGFNHLPNPNLIYVDQVLSVPPANYLAPAVSIPVPAAPAPVPVTAAPPSPAVSGGGGWSQVAICEEGGSNSATYGYFGIMPQSWASAGGTAYSPTAGGSSWDTQVMIGDRINGGGPPYAPAGCAAAGYHGW